VIFPDGSRLQASVKAVDPLWDLAVMRIGGKTRPAVSMATRKPQKGDLITFCGYGHGKYRGGGGKLLFYGSPVGVNRFELLNVGGRCRQGDSGGPLLNAAGDLVGVITDGGIEETTTGGPNCEIINAWLADVLSEKPAKAPEAPEPTPQPTPSKLAVLEAQIAALQARIAELERLDPIPAGNDGEQGEQGLQGEPGPAGEIDYSKLKPITIVTILGGKKEIVNGEVVYSGGKVIKTEKVSLGGTMRLRLFPIPVVSPN